MNLSTNAQIPELFGVLCRGTDRGEDRGGSTLQWLKVLDVYQTSEGLIILVQDPHGRSSNHRDNLPED